MKRDHNVQALSEIPNPSALVSLQFSDRSSGQIDALPRFKNVTDLDISRNQLGDEEVDLMCLKFLRRLTLADNCLSRMMELPRNLENLNLSGNSLTEIGVEVLQNLPRLHTLNLAGNQLTSVESIGVARGLRCLFLGFNQIQSIADVKQLDRLLELDIEFNLISELDQLQYLPSSVSVINIQGNPVLRSLLISKTAPAALTNFDTSELKSGLLSRHVERLKEVKTSRFRSRMRARSVEAEERDYVPVPRRNSSRKCSTGEMSGRDEELFQLRQEVLLLKTDIGKHKNKAKKAKGEFKDLHDRNGKLSEFYDRLVTLYNLPYDDPNVILDQLRGLEESRLRTESENLELGQTNVLLRNQIDELTAQSGKIEKLQAKNRKLKSVCIEYIKKVRQYERRESNEETIRLRRENEALKQEMQYTSRDLMGKIRELETANEALTGSLSFSGRNRFNASFDSDFLKQKTVRSVSPLNTSSIDLSYFRANPQHEGEVVINKKVGQYIEKLKDKISRLNTKISTLRRQRDSFKSQVHSYN